MKQKAGHSSANQLVELYADGSVRVIKALPDDTPVQPGWVLKRRRVLPSV